MNIAGLLIRPWYWIAGKVFATWARPAVQPDDPAKFLPGDDAETALPINKNRPSIGDMS